MFDFPHEIANIPQVLMLRKHRHKGRARGMNTRVYLNDLGGKLRRSVLQVMSIDGEHSVIAAQPSILCSQALFQQIKDKNTWFIGPSNEFNAKLFTRVPFVKDYVEDLFPGRATVEVAVGPVHKAPLSQHGQVQCGT